MNAELKAEVQAWIADDPDPKTAAQLSALVESGDEKL
jgi:phosphomannomutase